jgi:apolipoprotein N-acyltransferase
MFHINKRKKEKKKHWLPVCLLLILLVSGTVGAEAWLHMDTDPVTNTFPVAESVAPQISEEVSGDAGNITEKRNVTVNVGTTSVSNDAGYSVYVRAAVVITWQDSAGNVYIEAPEEEDYTIVYGDDWTYDSNTGYWYYNSVVKSGDQTTALIQSCSALAAAPVNGYTLNVKIIAQTIQSAGSTDTGNKSAVMDAWNYTYK